MLLWDGAAATQVCQGQPDPMLCPSPFAYNEVRIPKEILVALGSQIHPSEPSVPQSSTF